MNFRRKEIRPRTRCRTMRFYTDVDENTIKYRKNVEYRQNVKFSSRDFDRSRTIKLASTRISRSPNARYRIPYTVTTVITIHLPKDSGTTATLPFGWFSLLSLLAPRIEPAVVVGGVHVLERLQLGALEPDVNVGIVLVVVVTVATGRRPDGGRRRRR